jgi:isopentenyl-diphosphate delta-isomerase
MAKSLAIGASVCAAALPLVVPALNGPEDVKARLGAFLQELKTAMFLTGSATIGELMQSRVVITGKTNEYLNERGFDTTRFACR